VCIIPDSGGLVKGELKFFRKFRALPLGRTDDGVGRSNLRDAQEGEEELVPLFLGAPVNVVRDEVSEHTVVFVFHVGHYTILSAECKDNLEENKKKISLDRT